MRVVRLTINGANVGIPSDLLAAAISVGVPGFLTGDSPPKNMVQAAIKSAIKGLIPLVMTAMHKEIMDKHLAILPPDLRCPAAKANVVKYAISYLFANAFALAEQTTLIAQGEMVDGTFLITGFTPAPALDAAANEHESSEPAPLVIESARA